MTEPLIRDITDTARWVATYRARETERPDAIFRDPYARRLAGSRGDEIARAQPFAEENQWPFIARTYLFDRFTAQEIRSGADLVINLAAGLDARPYRMDLPPSLRWVEIDLPAILAYKEETLAGEHPKCQLERVPLDLSDEPARRALFERLGAGSSKTLVISEGLLVYLTESQVTTLGRDLTAIPSFARWLVDLSSPALLTLMMQQMSELIAQANLSYQFGPADGPAFFLRCGWKAVEVRSMFRTAAELNRLPEAMRPYAAMPDPPEPWKLPMPWSAVCLLHKA
jgi:methyltransferase (TIGR00027 family)